MPLQITNDFKEILEMLQNIFKDATSLLFTSLNQRIEDQNKLIYELRHSLEFSQEEIKEIKTKLTKSDTELMHLKKLNSDQEEKIEVLQNQIAKQEDYTRRKNLRIDGVEENENENWQQTQVKIQKMVDEKMKLKDIKVEYAHRLSKTDNLRGPRTIIAQFSNASSRDIVLRKSYLLKGTNTFVNEDLSNFTNRKRQDKMQDMKTARRMGKIAYFIKDRLIVKERPTTTKPPVINKEQFTPPRRVQDLVEAFTPEIQKETTENKIAPNPEKKSQPKNKDKSPQMKLRTGAKPKKS